MKVIPLSEAKANLSRYAHQCREEPVVVTVNGRPAFQLVPLAEDDDPVIRPGRGGPQPAAPLPFPPDDPAKGPRTPSAISTRSARQG